MIKPFEWLIAARYLKSKRKDSFISVVGIFSLVGIALGVATLIVVMSVMNGYHKIFLNNILGIQGHLVAVNTTGKFSDYDSYAEEISKIQGVKFVAPIVIAQSMAVKDSYSSGVIVRGISADKLEQKPLVKNSVKPNVLNEFEKGEGVIVGIDLARTLRIKAGDEVKIITTDTNSTVFGSIPRIKTFRVAGTFDVGLYQHNSTTIFMPLDQAQQLYRYGNTVTEVEIMTTDPENMDRLKNAIKNVSGNHITLVDWRKAQDKWLNALAVERNVMFLILTLIILVAVFNIVSSLIMLVKEKSRGIAILRTIGTPRTSILKIFMICGSMLGFIGTMIGAILGISFALNIENIRRFLESLTGTSLFDPVIYFLTKIPSDLDIVSVIFVVLLSLFFSVISTIYPALRASSLKPTEVLRYE